MSQIQRPCLSRREFLLAGGATVAGGALMASYGMATVDGLRFLFKKYADKKVAKLSQLRNDQVVEFKYPHEDAHSSSFLVKLGREAGGGVGPQKDIVAFNQICTHMGGQLRGRYSKEHKTAGPCPLHLSLFDLEKHGMIVSGHATESLPQVALKIEGDDVIAVGMLGLIWGYSDNEQGR